MARSDLLVSLVRASVAGDRSMLTSTVEAIVAEEKSHSHHVLADRLQRALQSVPVTTSNEMRRPQTGGRDDQCTVSEALRICPRHTMRTVLR